MTYVISLVLINIINITLDDNKYHLFSEVIIRVSGGWKNYFVINPAVIFKGSDSDKMKEMINSLFFE